MKNIKAILFDLDETLIIEWKSAEQSFRDTIEFLDHKIDKNDFVRVIRAEAKKLWYALPTIGYCLRVGISSWEALWGDFSGDDPQLKLLATLIDEYRLQTWHLALKTFHRPELDLARDLSNRYIAIRDTRHILFPETAETLQLLKKNYKLGLITNGAPDLQWRKIRGGRLTDYFECIVISGDYGYGKPDERLFKIAVEKLQVGTNQSMMVGDSLKTDITGAAAAGIVTVWLNRDKKENPDVPVHFEIDNLLQLKPILNSNSRI